MSTNGDIILMQVTDWNTEAEQALVYTDGSASVKHRTGGWSYVCLDDNKGMIEDSGGESDTTISRMELLAPINALWYLVCFTNVQEVLILSDSKYVVDGFMNPLRARNVNKDLWEELDENARHFKVVTMEHIHGHQGDHWNDLVDKAAVVARKSVPIQQKEEK